MAAKIESSSKIGIQLGHEQACRRALELAEYGKGFVEPNPTVGCVILAANGECIGEGFHEAYGGPHAEVNAFESVKDRSRLNGASVYVSLEPCSHFGKTPPCADLVVKHPVKNLFYGSTDPHNLVAGKGLKKIQDARINTQSWKELHVSEQVLNDLVKTNEVFFTNQILNRSFVGLKVASSLDGKMGLDSGESQWITNEEARQRAHLIRGQYGAMVVGVNTLLVDNPKLTIRHLRFPNKKSPVVIIDPNGRLSQAKGDLKIYSEHSKDKLFYVGPQTQGLQGKVTFIPFRYLNLKETGGPLDLFELASTLYQNYRICSMYVEGGGGTYSSFLEQRCMDRLHIMIGNSIIGGRHGVGWSQGWGAATLSQKMIIEKMSAEILSDNFIVSGIGPSHYTLTGAAVSN